MKNRKLPYFTIMAILLTVMLFVGYNAIVHINIQKMSYSENWGGHTSIGQSGMNVEPVAGRYGQNALVLTFDNGGGILYSELDSRGNIISEGREDTDFFNRNTSENIFVGDGKILFIRDSNLYMSEFKGEEGFGDEELILENCSHLSIVDGMNLTVFNDEWITSLKIEDGTISIGRKVENKWNLETAYIIEEGNLSFLYLLHTPNTSSVEVLFGSCDDTENLRTAKVIDSTKNMYYGYTSNVLKDGVFYTNTPIKIVGAQGSVTLSNLLVSVDMESGKIGFAKEFPGSPFPGLYNIDYNANILSIDGEVYFCGSGYNTENEFTGYNDIFLSRVRDEGSLGEPEYISNTYRFSRNPVLVELENSEYVAVWLDVSGLEYELQYNSTEEDYRDMSSAISGEDYKRALQKASVVPFYALSFMFIRSFFMLIVFFSVLGVIYMVMLNRGYKNWNRGLKVLVAVYIVINLLTFNFNYISGSRMSYMPDYLYGGIFSIIVPLVINGLSILALYIFHRERPDTGVLWKLILLIVLDSFYANLLYSPFLILGKLIN
ncbi:hypothetical protein SAMN02745751_01413 [Dethiosulfatibacter aminovorans DSM 17477]|uniref:Uncharacterized protein n=1 Tax=Dethiosulfatibacter aminovorans DSM 17477 TaxID=1121476 RepID=A0A1M6FAS0_9FIRM|nr:hypothetical protein [Dethiosulfatibacter aminovorans]SHI94746.1 hypothetical protein SAMN02745751_01413 [Dethiosulfatibacter aminovorans DSM 17477]